MGSFTPPPTTSLTPGDRLDRYELLCILAQGGMGTVWLARMTGKLGFERLVALKTILPTYSQDRQFGDMFLDEAKIAAQIDHENVARILEIGEDQGFLYYAMELIDGESLRKLYRDVRAAKQTFALGIALRIIADACAGLHATHELRDENGQPLGVVHRDVSPQNLLVSVRGTTKLIDFGVAKANSRSSEATAAGTLKGKIEYMAPEQAAGEALDRRADVYALGAVLYELLAGRPVRDTDEGKQLVALHELMTGAPYQPLPDNIPHLVRGVVDRALSRDVRMRFGSAEELRRALEQAMLATGQTATTDDVANMLAHFSRERTAKRKDVIERAVRAASEGRLVAATLFAPLSTRVMPASVSPSNAPGSMPSSGGGTPVSAAATGPFAPPGMGPTSYDGPPTGPSMHTIGAASMSAHPMLATAMPGSSAAKIFAGVFVLALVAVLGVVAGVLVTRRGQHRDPALASTGTTTASVVLTGEPVPAVDPGPVPAVAGEPVVPATGVIIGDNRDASVSPVHSTANGKDAGATGVAGGRGKGGGAKGGGKGGGKPGDPDEYGF